MKITLNKKLSFDNQSQESTIQNPKSPMSFLNAEWRKLLMANYEVNPELLKPYLPVKTELDLWNGTCYVSLVGFMFVNTKVLGLKIPFHVNFEEVNLRFYVKHFDGKEWKRGVVFIKEIVHKMAITFVANTIYGEHYETLKMKHEWKISENKLNVSYAWYKEKWQSFKVEAENFAVPIHLGSEEEFITEHYWGYTRISGKKTTEYEVGHPKWDIYPVKSYSIDVDFEQTYGVAFGFLDNEIPKSVFLAEGSEIFVKKMNTI
jgi:uncharacterized protein